MKIRALAIAFTLLAAGSAQAAPILVAGWDFSQFAPGFLTTDGGLSLTNTLLSNYSDLDATETAGIGTGSGFGTMRVDGTFGSFATPLNGNDPFRPQTPSILQNQNVAAVAGVPLGDAAASILLLNEATPSQESFNDVRMVARDQAGLLDVVFQADLGGAYLGDAWALSFGGVTATGTSSVAVEFSTDGSVYNPIGNAALTTTAQTFSFALGGLGLDEVFVRLRFTGSNTILPGIDNLALVAEVTPVGVPEPGTALLLLSGLAGLGAFGRRPRA
jgi:hypothetical protein